MEIVEVTRHTTPRPAETPPPKPAIVQLAPTQKVQPAAPSRQHKLKYALAAVVVVLGGIFGAIGIQASRTPDKRVQAYQAPPPEKPTSPAKQAPASFGLPVRLVIPKISVNAAVEHMGVTATGDMDTPKVPETVGWFSPGPRPGEKGSSVMDGHFGWKNDVPAVFDNLHLLQTGDLILVEDEKGLNATFVVRELRTYGREGDASDIFHSNDGKAHLNLITCQGTWDERQKSYSTRLVVFTDRL